MKKKALRKDIIMEIKKSFPRFISIFLIVALGVAFFSGVRAANPDLILTADTYIDEGNLMDLKVMSTLGMTEDDVNEIKQVDGVLEVEPSYLLDTLVTIGGKSHVLQLLSNTETINTIIISQGKNVEKDNEIVLDEAFASTYNIKIGDTITVKSGTETDIDEQLQTNEFTVVGTGHTPNFMALQRGNTTIGDGTVTAFAICTPTVFKSEVYTQVFVLVKGAKEETSYTKEYEDLVNTVKERLEEKEEIQCEKRYEEIYTEAEKQILEARQTFEENKSDAMSQLEDGRQQLDNGKMQLEQAKQQLEQQEGLLEQLKAQLGTANEQVVTMQAQLEVAKQSIKEQESLLNEKNAEYESQKKEVEETLKEAEEEITQAENELQQLEVPSWYLLDRDSLSDYKELGENAERIGAIGKVFPMIFFLVAALVSLTTMTRMVEEQRLQIGTLKALGYTKGEVAGKYIVYALSATLGGSVFGVLVGEKIFPYIIVFAYKIMYPNLNQIQIPYEWEYSLTATVMALCATLIATIGACYKELAEMPSKLMRPEAPKNGKRILLEKIPFLWKHFSFTYKSTFRNLFRYKKRLFMTVFGIASCMALIVVGFGIRDSMVHIGDMQYDRIQTYQATVMLEEGITEEQQEEIENYFNQEESIYGNKYMYLKSLDVSANEITKSAYISVPKTMEDLDLYFDFVSRTTKEEFQLSDTGVLITEQLAGFLNVKSGDTISINVGMEEKEVVVDGVIENYMMHYIYMSPKLYEQLYGEQPMYQSILLLCDDSKGDEERIASHLLEQSGVLGVRFTNDMREQVEDMLGALNIVVYVLIISAGLLAFIVLYNLNNININERKRELATIKVLGFYDNEVAAYVYRENIFLSIIGIVVGVFLGIILHRYIITTVEVNMVMFARTIRTESFVISGLLTLIFSAIVNGVTYFKLKKINMVESLKSVE